MKCHLWFRTINISVFTPKIFENPNFGGIFNAFHGKQNSNNFWTINLIAYLGLPNLACGLWSPIRTAKSAGCSKWKRMKIQDGRRTPFLASQDRALVKCVDRFERLIRQNACFGPRIIGCAICGLERFMFQVSPIKFPKTPIYVHFQCISYGKQNCFNLWTLIRWLKIWQVESNEDPEKCNIR
jgi:hypothetical protein